MRWQELSFACKQYLVAIYTLAIPVTILCFGTQNSYPAAWFLLTGISLFVATVNVRLPTISSVISMGDVFTILALTQFGPGPALIMYWMDMVAAHLTDVIRHHGLGGIHKIKAHKIFFNLGSCSLSIGAMTVLYRFALNSDLPYPGNFIAGLIVLATTWFLVNTVTLSVAISYWNNQSFWTVWLEGIRLALLNFFGSAAAAGLVTIFYAKAGFYIFLLSLPIAVVLYQLYLSYIERYEQAEAHISELNRLYFQTIETLSSAVEAKDRYTHGHIKRVQIYAVELARCLGIEDRKELSAIQAGALLHDIGKIAIPEYILNKPTVLTETEFEKMKIHPVVGANMLSRIAFPYPVLPMVKSHHERWDGNGYPDRLKGEEIPFNARILSVVDCYDALTTNRPYRSPMDRNQIVDFFRRESGRAYDPAIVATFIRSLNAIERAGNSVFVDDSDLWGIRVDDSVATIPGRKLQRVEPTLAYTKALSADQRIQRELYSIFEFARVDFECLSSKDVYSFVGGKLSSLIDFDVAVFYKADLATGQIVADHVEGAESAGLRGLALRLEQKLSGWVAANNQALCNLPPFPDFLSCEEPRPSFQISAIAPLNRHGTVMGAISLYRKNQQKFTDEEFRRLEMIASQTAIILAKCEAPESQTQSLLDASTGLPSGFHLYLMFEQVAIDASRYEYPLALILVGIDDTMNTRRKWGHLSGEEAIKTTSKYLAKELRETDLLVRYASDEFIALNPKTTREQAEDLKSRLQNDLDHFCFAVRADVQVPLRASIGIALYPEDATDLESLIGFAENRMQEDRQLRLAVRSRVKRLPTSS